MSPLLKRLLACVLVVIVLAATLTAQQSHAPSEKVLVLRNGRVLRGDLTKLGDKSVVVLNNGGQIQLPTRDIAVEASSLDEAYQALRTTLVAPEKAAGHLDLARWCINEGLHAQAADELLVALQIDPHNPRIEELHRQLSFVTSAKPTAKPSAASLPANKPVDAKQLDELARSMPKEAVEQFTTSIQPLLINRCGTNRCHDSGSTTSFRLIRPLNGERFWRRMTLRNLFATHAQLNTDAPQESRLLKMAATAHGGQGVAALQEEPQQLAALCAWIQMATNQTVVATSEPYDDADQEPRTLSPDIVARPLNSPNDSTEQRDELPRDSGADAVDDPFDPEKFNEQFLSAPN